MTHGGDEPSPEGGPTGPIVLVAHGALMPLVYERLTSALGPRRAGEVLREALRQTGNRLVDTPEDILLLAEAIMKQGGMVEAVGRALKVQAKLRGAVAT